MPLPIRESCDLELPGELFNDNGVAVIQLSGGRYAGDWEVSVLNSADGPRLGRFSTEVAWQDKPALEKDPRYPYLALETGFAWLMGQAAEHGWRVVGYSVLNHLYDSDTAPYFCLAQAVIANRGFTPSPGVEYADEMTLDQVMGYSTAKEG
jgi:hypothetical protein